MSPFCSGIRFRAETGSGVEFGLKQDQDPNPKKFEKQDQDPEKFEKRIRIRIRIQRNLKTGSETLLSIILNGNMSVVVDFHYLGVHINVDTQENNKTTEYTKNMVLCSY